ncbi:aldehyde dehydrogenase [Arthrobacter sp. P2b]|uniref:aldehyde dehydrogenase n=1 Tax=Arthrobacter sp. P2b TaxID=1938741 RepID=UPI0009A5800C|nr:aldehyde dehydrogenase [Arthrobacter sp. P2b]SLK10503.1 Acyl-CoA reductase [Arthrobacter sp. P2b]
MKETLTSHTDYDSLYIGGAWSIPSTKGLIDVVSPTTELPVGQVPLAAKADVDSAVAAARGAFDDPAGWSSWAPAERAAVLRRFADELESRGPETARRVSIQNGMPTSFAMQAEAQFPAVILRFYADLVSKNEAEEVRSGFFGGSTLVTREPIGVVAAIVPWNVPQSITFMKLAPALAAGCTVVLKPATETVLDAFLMAEAAVAAGLPGGVLNVVPGGPDIGAYLVEHPGVNKVSFTGSTAAGRSIGQACGQLLRPVTLELGGKSAAVVLDDADLAANVDNFFAATLLNNGQICHLGTRILVPRSRYKELVDFVTDLAGSLVVGDPLVADTQVGPLVSAKQRARVEGYIQKGKEEGARLTTGSKRPDGPGWFVTPTVFADVDNSFVIAQEEIFGPVLSIIPYHDEADAIAIANDSSYGLGGTVWTTDTERGNTFARKIHSGTVGINAYLADLTAPFGGIKTSGIGRELGAEGLGAYQQFKSIYLDRNALPATAAPGS